MSRAAAFFDTRRTAMRTRRPKATLMLSTEQQDELENWARRRSTAQELALRGRIILACAAGGETAGGAAHHAGSGPASAHYPGLRRGWEQHRGRRPSWHISADRRSLAFALHPRRGGWGAGRAAARGATQDQPSRRGGGGDADAREQAGRRRALEHAGA